MTVTLARALLACALALAPRIVEAQRTAGEIRIDVRDAAGAAAVVVGTVNSDGTGVRRSFITDASGGAAIADLPFGRYRVVIEVPGFAAHVSTVDVRSELPVAHAVVLRVAGVTTTVTVSPGDSTILDPFRAGAVHHIGADALRERPAAAPGRSLIDLINTQPGILLEANGILHARGSEYQVQYIVDGIPLRDNRSPAFAQTLGVQEFESLALRTGGYPAEFGGKLGAVVEVTTTRDTRPGVHGLASFEAGSFGSVSGYAAGQYARGGTTIGVGMERMVTDRYLDPPTEHNFTNHGAATGGSGRLEHAWHEGTRTRAYAYRRASRFQVPNEALQQAAGQRQERTATETLAQASHQQVWSPTLLFSARGMARSATATLRANDRSVPIRPSQDRRLREIHVNGSVSRHYGRHETKVGGELTVSALAEVFASTITARELGGFELFDDDVPATMTFDDRGRAREHALFAQNLARLGPLTLATGLRYDHYRLRNSHHGLSPRLSGSWFAAPLGLVVHASYDRTLETPPTENILLASANVVEEFGGEGESRAIEPSRGHFLEAGLSKQLSAHLRLDAAAFSRRATHVIDDDLLLNTGVSFPVTFSRAVVTGLEGRLELVGWGAFSARASYSHMDGRGYLPFAGGLFLGDEAEELLEGTGAFRLSQDQTHTIRTRTRVGLGSRAWVAVAGSYNSGLPIEAEGVLDEALLVRQYGKAVVAQADLDDGRVRASWSLDASVGATLVQHGERTLRAQADVFNLTDRLNVINIAGLLSGTALAPRRWVTVRLVGSW